MMLGVTTPWSKPQDVPSTIRQDQLIEIMDGTPDAVVWL
jgi:hypothetical protein